MDAITAVTKAPEIILELRKHVKKRYYHHLDAIRHNPHDYIGPDDTFVNQAELRGQLLLEFYNLVRTMPPAEKNEPQEVILWHCFQHAYKLGQHVTATNLRLHFEDYLTDIAENGRVEPIKKAVDAGQREQAEAWVELYRYLLSEGLDEFEFVNRNTPYTGLEKVIAYLKTIFERIESFEGLQEENPAFVNDKTLAGGPPTTRELLMESIFAKDPIVQFRGKGGIEIFDYKYTDGNHYGGLYANDTIIWTTEPKWIDEDDCATAEDFILTMYEMHNDEPRKEEKTFRFSELSKRAQDIAIYEYRDRAKVYDENDITVASHLSAPAYKFTQAGKVIS